MRSVILQSALPANNVFDTVTNIGNDATDAVLVVGGLVAVLFVIIIAWKSGGAMGAVIGGLVSAAIFIWALNNIGGSGVQDQIGNTINGAPASTSWVQDLAA